MAMQGQNKSQGQSKSASTKDTGNSTKSGLNNQTGKQDTKRSDPNAQRSSQNPGRFDRSNDSTKK